MTCAITELMKKSPHRFAKGNKHTKAWYEAMAKRKIPPKREDILCACGCGKLFNKYDKKNRVRKVIYGHQCAKPWLGKKRESMMGEKNWKWKGGTSRRYRMGYYSFEYRAWRKSVFERDAYICQDCGFHGSKGYLTAHHN